MKKISAVTITKYASAIIVGGLLSSYVMVVNDYNNVTDEAEKMRLLADCFTVPGMVLIMLAALCWLSSKGALDGISYAVVGLFRRLLPGAQSKEPEKYYDYVVRKQENRKKGFEFLAVVGAGFLLIAIIFIVKFYQVYQ